MENVVDLTRPSLAGLSVILKDRKLWPEGFEWDFNDERHCAVGLAQQVWDLKGTNASQRYRSFKEALGLDGGVALSLFYYGDPEIEADNITPEMIAARIDKYLSSPKAV